MLGSILRKAGAPLLIGLILLVSATALAQSDAEASAHPEIAPPGGDLLLTFTIDAPDLVEIAVEERVTCTVTFPEGAQRDACEAPGSLVDVRTSGSGATEYVFAYQAPQDEGGYEVTFETDATLRLLPQTYTATTTFQVATNAQDPTPQDDPEDPQDPNDPTRDPDTEPTDDPGGAEDSTPDSDGDILSPVPPMDGDSVRVMVTSTLAIGALGVASVATRFPLRGR